MARRVNWNNSIASTYPIPVVVINCLTDWLTSSGAPNLSVWKQVSWLVTCSTTFDTLFRRVLLASTDHNNKIIMCTAMLSRWWWWMPCSTDYKTIASIRSLVRWLPGPSTDNTVTIERQRLNGCSSWRACSRQRGQLGQSSGTQCAPEQAIYQVRDRGAGIPDPPFWQQEQAPNTNISQPSNPRATSFGVVEIEN